MNQDDPTVLLVEDDDNDVFFFQVAVQQSGLGWRVETVRDGIDAVAYLTGVDEYADRQRFPWPRLLVLDLKMPRMDGLEVLAWKRRQPPPILDLPAVMLSASSSDNDCRRALELGVKDYLVKPGDPLELAALLPRLTRWLQ